MLPICSEYGKNMPKVEHIGEEVCLPLECTSKWKGGSQLASAFTDEMGRGKGLLMECSEQTQGKGLRHIFQCRASLDISLTTCIQIVKYQGGGTE